MSVRAPNRVCPHCGGSLTGVVRLSLSLPAELAHWLRDYAKTRNLTVSAVVAEALRFRMDSEAAA